MKYYKYLEELSHAKAWVDGGEIPIKPAGSYLSLEREGIMTPDEVLQLSAPGLPITPIKDRPGHFDIGGMVDVWVSGGDPCALRTGGRMTFENCTFNGVPVNGELFMKGEDPLILCFTKADSAEKELADRMGKNFVVEITNLEKIKASIDRCLGVEGVFRDVLYTASGERNHFLKNDEDSWQQEFRIIWHTITAEDCWVALPPGCAKIVDF